jgi:hypothetical protein
VSCFRGACETGEECLNLLWVFGELRTCLDKPSEYSSIPVYGCWAEISPLAGVKETVYSGLCLHDTTSSIYSGSVNGAIDEVLADAVSEEVSLAVSVISSYTPELPSENKNIMNKLVFPQSLIKSFIASCTFSSPSPCYNRTGDDEHLIVY